MSEVLCSFSMQCTCTVHYYLQLQTVDSIARSLVCKLEGARCTAVRGLVLVSQPPSGAGGREVISNLTNSATDILTGDILILIFSCARPRCPVP